MTDLYSTRRRARTAALFVLAGLVLGGGGPIRAGTLDGDAIIDKMIKNDPFGYGGAETRLLMVLVNSRNQQRKRKVVMFSRKSGDTRRTFLRFLSPADIQGTAFLGIDNNGTRVQHLYLPALSKTRRISSRQRNASFVGTDYSYADLDMRDVNDSVAKRLPDARIGKYNCYVVDAKPTDSKSIYGRIRVWIDKKSMLPLRMRLYDKRGNERKRLLIKQLKKVGKRWVIAESKMVDLKRQHTTVFKLVEIDTNKTIPMSQFTVRALERG